MKPVLLLLSVALASGILVAQTATVPDSVFRNMLIQKYPTVIDANGKLIIAEAAKVSGTINGSNLAIESIEGVQFFTSVVQMSFVRTGLKFVPDLSNMVNLQNINLMYNNLYSLPSLKALKRLKVLNVHSNHLKVLPDLSKNDSLVELNVNTNLLDSLPDLSKLIRLEKLYIHNNNIKKVNGLASLASLVEFWCYGNQIQSFPVLDKLKKIKWFDASKNLLTSAPDFGSKSGVKIIDIDNNYISKLPDYSTYDSLQKVVIFNNKLTFSELVKLTTINRYDTVCKIFPQQTISISKSIKFLESDSYSFKTKTDTLLNNISYNWYRNKALDSSVSVDNFKKSYLKLQDSGKYSCRVTHPSFPNFYLQTDTISLSISPCVNVQDLSVSVTEINCLKTGTLDIQLPKGDLAKYELKSLGSGKSIVSSTGRFVGLSETDYELYVSNSVGCTKKYPIKISVPFVKCKDYLITPDNDGNADTFYFEASGKAEIYDKRGNLVKRLSIPAEWDCTSEKGKVATGYYIATINDGESQIGLSVVY